MEIKIIQEWEWEAWNSTLIIKTDLPERGLGIPAETIARTFKREVLEIIKELGPQLRGATVRLCGPNILANAVFAGFAFGKAGAHRIEQEQQGGIFVTIAAHDDPEAPVPIIYEPGMIVEARLFGHEAEVEIISVGLGRDGRSRRLQVKGGHQTAWIDEADVIKFVRWR